MRGCELSAYMHVWNHYRLVELPWDSAWTWWFTFVGVDFGYYWVHRFAHGTSRTLTHSWREFIVQILIYKKKMFCVTSYVNSCCFLRVFWKHNCSFTWRVQLKSSESRPKKTNDIPDFKFACSPSVVFTIVSQSIQTIAQEESLLLHACLFFCCFNYKFIVIISLAEKFECRHIVTY